MEIIDNDYNKRLEKAEKRVKQLKDFYQHLMRYIIIVSFLAIVNWLTSPGYWWVLWVIASWGMTIVIQAISLYNNGVWGHEWEKRKVKKMIGEE